MKEIVNLSQACAYLEKLFNTLNRDKFDGTLPTPIITVQSRPMTYGHCTVSAVWKNIEENRYEINIAAEYLNRSIDGIVETLLHQMVHLYQLIHGIKGVSRGGYYHNKSFKEQAESVGLCVAHDNTHGWAITSVSEELKVYIQQKKWEKMQLYRSTSGSAGAAGADGEDDTDGEQDPENTEKGKNQKKPSSTRKYSCPCCCQSIRATKRVNIICGYCNFTMLSELGEGA